jgi:hypothetical protein
MSSRPHKAWPVCQGRDSRPVYLLSLTEDSVCTGRLRSLLIHEWS